MRHSLLEGLGLDFFFLEPGWATVCWKKFWGASGFLSGWATVCWKDRGMIPFFGAGVGRSLLEGVWGSFRFFERGRATVCWKGRGLIPFFGAGVGHNLFTIH